MINDDNNDFIDGNIDDDDIDTEKYDNNDGDDKTKIVTIITILHTNYGEDNADDANKS